MLTFFVALPNACEGCFSDAVVVTSELSRVPAHGTVPDANAPFEVFFRLLRFLIRLEEEDVPLE